MHYNHSRKDGITAPLYVLTPIFNPLRYRSRYSLYEEFAKNVEQAGGILYTVEIAFGDREFAVTSANNDRHLQLRSLQTLWHKERAIKLLEQRRLPNDWEYLAWVDADVGFTRPDWVQETIQQLQHNEIVQLWSEAIDLNSKYQMLDRHQSFAASYLYGTPQAPTAPGFEVDGGTDGYYPGAQTSTTKQLVGTTGIHPWHPGFAWAINRQAWEEVGGLLDSAVLGAADNHMAKALLGDGARSYNKAVSFGYKQEVLSWQTRAKRLQRDIGVVDGLLYHYWHGPKANRKYWDRWQILVETQFDPTKDLYVEANGLFAIRNDNVQLRDKIRQYFAQRNEDQLSD